MPDEVERKGLGTPATRAGVIEKLVRIGFVERQGNKKTKYLVTTDKGTSLITVREKGTGKHRSYQKAHCTAKGTGKEKESRGK